MIKISAASARLPFTPCGPECLAAGCRGACCDAPTRPGGCLVTVHPSERHRLAALGASFVGDFIKPAGSGGCPFKEGGLCAIHVRGKPFGCVASPFTLNRNGTLIIRNRYKLLPCYRGPGPKRPAYIAFYGSLMAIFGADGAMSVRKHLNGGGGDLHAAPLPGAAEMLRYNDAAKRAA